ncbi:hypothetical protein HLH17_02275 [Acinetobacter sp. ANC 5380]|uniref:Uncharacterized protein n=1 Tax=Acinetobacter terrae TaxID=2731247 RepID=A0A7Y2RD72_9GAMM|nr:hypothetical protein [Acinetobacter terrae]NNH76527.1 hypothetical protein [Acinetobacter terrae]
MSPIKILSYSLILVSTSNLAYAELVQLDVNSRLADRIEILSSQLSQGDYSNSDEDDLDDESAAMEAEAVVAAELDPILIQPKDYKRLGIKNSSKIYSDSEIWYLPKRKEYIEEKIFSNNTKFFRVFGVNGALIFDINDGDPDDESWAVSCSRDHITDEKSCVLSKYEMIFIRSSKSGWMFSVSTETEKLNPYQYQYLRIDKSSPLKTRTYFKGQQVLNIIEQMKKGNTAYTRFYEWSKEYEETIPLKGFTVAYNALNIMYSKF